jgi:putative endonuclease
MAKHNEIGKKGETLAQNFLLNKGYQIVAANWTVDKKEIDLIVQKEDWIVFVEVKTRRGTAFGFPEESVTLQKQAYLRYAADCWLDEHPGHFRLRFDIISILLRGETVQELKHIEDAFF